MPAIARIFSAALLFTVLGLGPLPAHADSFNFIGTVAGSSVNGTAILTGTAGSNVLTLKLTNNVANIVTVAQSISGFAFSVLDAGGNPINIDPLAITGQSGPLIVVGSGGLAVHQGLNGSGPDTLHWGVTGNPDFITALGFPGAGNPPDETILGAPTSGLTYSSANGSIAGNAGHQPFVMQSADFDLQIGRTLPYGFQFTNVTMYFGATAGNGLTGECVLRCGPQGPESTVPEPGSLLLLGTGLAALGLWRFKA